MTNPDLDKLAEQVRDEGRALNGSKAMMLVTAYHSVGDTLEATPPDKHLAAALSAVSGALAMHGVSKESPALLARTLADGTNRADMDKAIFLYESAVALLKASMTAGAN